MLRDLQLQKKILLVDGDSGLLSIRNLRLMMDGFAVCQVQSAAAALEAMWQFSPDLVVLDPAVPGIAGETLLQALRSDPRYGALKIVVNSTDASDSEHRYCGALGADAHLVKPVAHEQLLGTIRKLLHDEMTVTFWGTRGSMARPGIGSLKFGGNTPCVSVELGKDRFFVFDAGTGIADFGRRLAQAPGRYRFNLFLTHPRWEHIQGLPFFKPLRCEGNEMVVHGPGQRRLSLRAAMEAHAGHVCRPVVVDEFGTRMRFHELDEGEYLVDGLQLDAILLDHPGRALGYRLQGESGQVVAYLAENEIRPGDHKARRRLADFVAGADILIHGASYFDHEYRLHSGRGGSPLSEVVHLAADACVRSLYLFNHDPEHDDEAVTGMQELARGYFEDLGIDVRCAAAAEGETVTLQAPESTDTDRNPQRAKKSPARPGSLPLVRT